MQAPAAEWESDMFIENNKLTSQQHDVGRNRSASPEGENKKSISSFAASITKSISWAQVKSRHRLTQEQRPHRT